MRTIAGYDDLNASPASPARPHLCWGPPLPICCHVLVLLSSHSKPFQRLEQWHFSHSLSRKIFASRPLSFMMSEPSMYSAISWIFNPQLSDSKHYWDIILFLVWYWGDAILAVVLLYIIPHSAEAVMIYWLTLSISLTLGGSRSKRKLRRNSCTTIRG